MGKLIITLFIVIAGCAVFADEHNHVVSQIYLLAQLNAPRMVICNLTNHLHAMVSLN